MCVCVCVWTVGESSGKASKGLAKHIPGAGGLQHLQQQAGASGGEFARARLVRGSQDALCLPPFQDML